MLSVRHGMGPEVWCNIACCCFMLGLYKEANTFCEKGTRFELKVYVW